MADLVNLQDRLKAKQEEDARYRSKTRISVKHVAGREQDVNP
jgi:hypothetical protein